MKRALTIYYDDETGELAKIASSAAFEAESVLMQADVLKDAVHALTLLYADAANGVMNSLAAGLERAHD